MFRLIIDTETCGSLNRPLVYDFGGVVVDSDFNIVDSFDYVIRDIFFERRAQMETAYYAEKLPSYFMDIANGIRKVVSFKTATDNVNNLISKYNISEVWAYNAIFDTKALNNTISVLSNGFVNTYFNGVTVKCIMAAFKQSPQIAATILNARSQTGKYLTREIFALLRKVPISILAVRMILLKLIPLWLMQK